MKETIQKIKQELSAELKNCQNSVQIQDVKSQFLGNQSPLNELLKSLKNLSPLEKKEIGPILQEAKREMEQSIFLRLKEMEKKQAEEKLLSQWIDLSATNKYKAQGNFVGAYHPVTLIQREVEDIFQRMGFMVLDGPHIEDDFHNFSALNIPEDHPAREMQDTFWFSDKIHLLRTHTSTIQVRGMESFKPPFRFIGPGKVFRCERTDASHEFSFHQLEGMMVDEGITVGNLIYFMKSILTEIFQTNVEVRLRPGYFPFVEPGFELDIRCLICSGNGCSVCKKVGWVELCPCGMVHPNVFEINKIDSTKYSGFAFGLGLDRLVMMKYGINDIRFIHKADLRFHQQFNFV